MKTQTISVGVIGFFTFWMFWTLNGASGRDMNDVMVEYWDAKTQIVKETSIVVAK